MHRHASLNRIYRLVWSHVHQAWVVVAECARGRGKRASRKLLLAAAALAALPLAQAGPTGGQVTAGSGSIARSGTTTTVNQTSGTLSLQWQSFDTGASETVNFAQPSRSAIAVNRILDTNATQFFGKLNANGQVYLINPNGVLFGTGSRIDVGGLVASTLNIADAAVDGATRRFAGTGNEAGRIVNHGEITAAPGGYVAFIGGQVGNQGTIAAPAGSVALGAGSKVTLSFAGNSLVRMQVDRGTLHDLADNGGLIRADGGAVLLSAGARDSLLASVVNNTGVIEARSVHEVNGTIVLEGGAQGTVSNGGTLDASGRQAGETGGSVKLLGQDITLAPGSRIDVGGDQGGGTALVGGNFGGAGPERNARATTVAGGALIDADAIASGNGGRVALWSDGTTRFDGRISARGGATGGDGGSVETSGHQLKIGAGASVATLAPRGAAGEWLLDPQDFTIGGFEPGDGDIDGALVTAALQFSNVTIKTGPAVACTNVACSAGQSGNGDIILANGALVGGNDWTSGTTLTLSAYRNVDLRGTANIDAGAGAGSIVLRADNSGTGTGTVILGNQSNIFGSGSGSVKIYYNPTSYATPTDYAGLLDMYGNPTIQYANLNSYMLVNLGAAIANKSYDGNTNATIAAIWPNAGLPSGIVIDTSGAHASFASKNAGANKAVTIDGIVMGGANVGLYALNGLDGRTATINKANLALSGVSANNKTYDGTTAATLSGSATVSAFSGDVVSVAGSGAGSVFANKNAGSGKTVTVNGYSLAGLDAGNYNLVMPTGLSASIGKASLAVLGLGAAGKTYDGTVAATLTGSAHVTAFGTDVVSVAGSGSATFADKNAGSGKPVTVTGYTLAGADAGNYNIVQPAGLSATINKASLALAGLGVADKTYDGTTAATLTGSATVSAIGSDVVGVAGSGSAAFADKNAGTNKTVIVGGFSLSGPDAGNYNLVMPGGLSADIGKASLALSGLSANGKTYDGTVAATLSGSATVNAFGSDVVSVAGSGSATFADKNAGTGKLVTVGGYTLGGLDAGNYDLLMPMGLTADIGKAALAVSGITANSKTYDGGTSATLGGSATVSALGSDVVSVAGSGSGSFADKNAGNGKAVAVTGFTLAGLDAANYEIVQPAGLVADIGKAGLTVGGLSATGKVYDGTTAATLAGSASVNAFGSDVVNVSGSGSATFADKNAGSNKAVIVGGFSLGGPDAGNYSLTQPSGLTADIARADLVLSGISANGKTYDGTVAATLSGSATVHAFGSDIVSLAGSGSALFANKDAGAGKAVTVSGYTLGGLDAGNYNLVMPAGLTADIGKAALAVTGISANSKTYDGGTLATLGGSATVAAFGSDVVSVAGSGSGSFADKNAGNGKTVSVSGFTLAGLDAANYDIVQPTGLVADIGKAGLTIGGLSAVGKVYDGTTTATLAGTATVAGFGSDAVAVSGSGNATFVDKNAGSAKAVVVSGFSLSGLDAGNYTLAQPAGLTADIGRADLLLSGLSANGKTYDGTLAATLSGSATVSAFGSDMVSLAGSGSAVFTDKNAGAGKAVTVGGFSLSGLDAGNYNLVMPTGLSADIGKAALAVTGITAKGKTYDGGTIAMLGGSATVNAFGSDVVNVAGSGSATFTDKHAGNGKAVTVSGFSLAGPDAANYEIVQPAGLTADIGKAGLSVTGLSAIGKVYDGTVSATLAGTATVAAFGNDAVSLSGSGSAAFADRNAGSGKAVLVTGYSLSGPDAGNYTLAQPAGLSADIARADLVLSGVHANGKTYDGTLAATLAGTATVAAFGSDVVNAAGSGRASFVDKNAGSGKAVTVGGYTLAGLDAGNYHLVMPTGLTADIGKASLAITGVTALDKTYDGDSAATLAGQAGVSAFGSDAVRVAGSASARFADKNAGSGKAVTVSGYILEGADAGNYEAVQPTGISAAIGKATLAVTGLSASDKVYDGSIAATLAGSAGVAAFGDDVVGLTGNGSAVFADRNAGSGKAVTVSGYALSGLDAGNYTLVQPTGLRANIAKAKLAVSGVTAQDKTYDGSTAATLAGKATVAAIGSDSVRVAGSGTASFADKNAGSAKAVAVAGFTLEGADAGNYTLIQPTGLRADIARAGLAVTGVSANGKTYDGTTAATLSGNATVSAFAGDAVGVAGTGIGTFADRNAGSGKTVTVSGYFLNGADAGNYRIVQPGGLRADIGKAVLALGGLTADSKVYDGTLAAVLKGSATVAPIGSDEVSVTGTPVATFADKNAGSGKAVSVGGYTLGGLDAGNYELAMPSGLRAAITPARLVVSGITANDKTWDGGTAASVSTAGAVLGGRIGSDSVTVSSSGSFADAAAGTGKTVRLTNTYGGADAANYEIVDQATALASIAALPQVPATDPVRNTLVQLQSAILPAPAGAQPRDLHLSSTVKVVDATEEQPGHDRADGRPGSGAIDTRVGAGTGAPMLRIRNGGVQLPPLATTLAE